MNYLYIFIIYWWSPQRRRAPMLIRSFTITKKIVGQPTVYFVLFSLVCWMCARHCSVKMTWLYKKKFYTIVFHYSFFFFFFKPIYTSVYFYSYFSVRDSCTSLYIIVQKYTKSSRRTNRRSYSNGVEKKSRHVFLVFDTRSVRVFYIIYIYLSTKFLIRTDEFYGFPRDFERNATSKTSTFARVFLCIYILYLYGLNK